MAQRIFNTKSGRAEVFQPVNGNRASMYVCGPTVYDLAHIGHARSYVFFDVLRRHLTSLGIDLHVQMNFTDIDEKISAKAKAQGRDPMAVAAEYIAEFQADMEGLKVLPPDIYTRSSESVGEIIEVVRSLLKRGDAYREGDWVYFDHTKTKVFGKLTHQKITEMLAAQASDPKSPKHSLLDFAIWQPPKDGDPSWDSPWGRGKPGWHLECYVMSRDGLGHPLDIKGGGLDLIYPHHESEWAVCDALTGGPYARFFVHNGFVNFAERKMSKSLGNFITVREVLSKYAPGAVRLWLLSSPYRSSLPWSPEALESARARHDALTQRIARLRAWEEGLEGEASGVLSPTQVPRRRIQELEAFAAKYRRAMEADLDLPAAVAALEAAAAAGESLVADSALDPEVRKVAAHVALSSLEPMNETLQLYE